MPKDYIERRDGGYFVAGNRVSLDSVVYDYRNGDSPERIRENFDLTLEEVHGAIAFYLANRDEIDAYLVRAEAAFEEARQRQNHISPELRERLQRARELMIRHS